MTDQQLSQKNQWLQLTFLLMVGLVLGLFFLFALPPWQHYDEQNHFEYVWLAANQDRLPRPGDYNRDMSQQVMISMGLHRFWGEKQKLVYQPEENVVIAGYSQLHEPPFYYLAASIPLRFLKNEKIEIQLYAARMVSLLFYLITIFAAWKVAQELSPPGHVIRWLLPLSLIFLPSFTDLMTAVNSDTAAVAVSSLFIWISVRMLKRGFSWLGLVALTLLGGLAFLTKNTAMFVLAIYPLVILFSIVRSKWRGIAWGFVLIILACVLALSLLLDDPLDWFRGALQKEALRVESQQAVHGDFVLFIKPSDGRSPDWWPLIAQSIPSTDTKQLAGKKLNFGFWVWSDQSGEDVSPVLHVDDLTFSINVPTETSPRFYSFSFQVPDSAERIWLTIKPKRKEASVYYDGFVLVDGNPDHLKEPVFQGLDGSTVVWGEQSFHNWLRNPSAELAGPRFRPVIDQYGFKILPDGIMPSLLVQTLIDTQGMQHVHATAAERLFRNFWGKFSWGHIGLMGWKFMGRPYYWLAIFTALGVVGLIIASISRWKRLDKTLFMVLFILLVIAWGFNFLRGVPYVVNSKLYLSVARHIFPVIIPTMLFFVVGWTEIIRVLACLWRRMLSLLNISAGTQESLVKAFIKILQVALVFIWISLTAGALVSILSYYKIL